MLDVSKFLVRTDLAVEAKGIAENAAKKLDGVKSFDEVIDGVKVTCVEVEKCGEKAIGKKAGVYVTIEICGVREQDTELQIKTERVLAQKLAWFMKRMGLKKNAKCLVVGLGNYRVTPDAIGPMVVENIMVTNHLFTLQPEAVSEGFRPVCALTPGVMGNTGMETSDIISGVVEKLAPDFVIAIDALAARAIERVNSTIQITDTGIHPGSGVGNARNEISQNVLGVPVISIGVPTVVDAVTITSDALDFILRHLGKEINDAKKPSKALIPDGFKFGKNKKLDALDLPDDNKRKLFMGVIGELSEAEKRELISEVLTPHGHNLMVTPKEIDKIVEDVSHLLASGLNAVLHEAVTQDNAFSYTR